MSRTLILAERAHAMLVDDCREYPTIETGGLLVGRRLGDEFVVPFVVPAGPGAHRSAGGFAPDTDFQQHHLDFLFTRFGLDYVGDYHKHPVHHTRPSAVDRQTARQIVTDTAWSKPEALFPIVVIRSGRVLMRAFLMRRDGDDFEELPVEVVPDHDRRIRRLLLSTLNPRKEADRHVCVSCGRRGSPRCRGIRRLLARFRPNSAK